MNKVKVGVIGATGYAGCELVRLMTLHPYAEVTAVSSVSFEGQKMSEVYPSLLGICDLTLTDADSVVAESDVVFTALPHGLSEELAEKTYAAGKILVDFGADFRLDSEEEYKQWYGKPFAKPELHEKSLYCLPELHRSLMKDQLIIASPGCYPTAAALGTAPALIGGFIDKDGIIIDAKSGVTGAGRGLTQGTHYPDTNDAFSAYKAGAHRHTPEIEQTLTKASGKDIRLTFVPHLLPANRGIEESIYCRMTEGTTVEAVHAYYSEFYANEKFVRVLPLGTYANIKNVRASNYCDISFHTDRHTNTLIICSCIDNMVKGAAGQAIQNMNLRMGWDESCGLLSAPPCF